MAKGLREGRLFTAGSLAGYETIGMISTQPLSCQPRNLRQRKKNIGVGARFNRIAALLTGISALAQFSAWIVTKLWH
jgi:hypothetical protein